MNLEEAVAWVATDKKRQEREFEYKTRQEILDYLKSTMDPNTYEALASELQPDGTVWRLLWRGEHYYLGLNYEHPPVGGVFGRTYLGVAWNSGDGNKLFRTGIEFLEWLAEREVALEAQEG